MCRWCIAFTVLVCWCIWWMYRKLSVIMKILFIVPKYVIGFLFALQYQIGDHLRHDVNGGCFKFQTLRLLWFYGYRLHSALMSSQRRPQLQTQPRTYKVTLKSILSLPVSSPWFRRMSVPYFIQYRLCNPPPAVGKVRSCSGMYLSTISLARSAAWLLTLSLQVTPILNVRLEDILDRKHLPPLGMCFVFLQFFWLFTHQNFPPSGLKDFEVNSRDLLELSFGWYVWYIPIVSGVAIICWTKSRKSVSTPTPTNL